MKSGLILVGIDDLPEVLRWVLEILDLWEDLGMALRLSQGKLSEIKSDNTTAKERMKGVLRAWLNKGGSGLAPSWQNLSIALRDKLVDRGKIAEAIEREVLTK